MTQTWKSPARQPRPRQSPSDEWEVPVFCFLGVFLAGAAGFFLVLYSLAQPTRYPNPGVAAYVGPPGTRLVPLPRQSTAPELAELPVVDSPSPLTAFAKAKADDQPHDSRPPTRKRPRAGPSAYGQRGFGSDQQWNFGSHGTINNHVWSGGPKSWF